MSIAHAPLHILRDESRASYDVGNPAPANPRGHVTVMTDEARSRARSLGMAAAGLYMDLEGRCNANGECWPKVETLAADFGCSVRHVQVALAKLRDAGLVEVRPRFGFSGLQVENALYLPLHTRPRPAENPSSSRGEVNSPEIPQIPSFSRGEAKGEVGGEVSCAHVMEVSINDEVEDISPSEKPTNPTKPTRIVYPPEFERFWTAYPLGHGSKKDSLTAWNNLRVDDALLAEIMAGIEAWRQSERWRGGFIKDAERFLKGRLWENPGPPPASAVPATNGQIDPELQAYFDQLNAEVRELSERRPDPTHPGRRRDLTGSTHS